mmetsp:Transcript_2788/g.4322  ORF Transcript_2788/g.4322 Transcript_2788/m.4322 type:complete len:447 (+) Transcript_2788:154-1494(+)
MLRCIAIRRECRGAGIFPDHVRPRRHHNEQHLPLHSPHQTGLRFCRMSRKRNRMQCPGIRIPSHQPHHHDRRGERSTIGVFASDHRCHRGLHAASQDGGSVLGIVHHGGAGGADLADGCDVVSDGDTPGDQWVHVHGSGVGRVRVPPGHWTARRPRENDVVLRGIHHVSIRVPGRLPHRQHRVPIRIQTEGRCRRPGQSRVLRRVAVPHVRSRVDEDAIGAGIASSSEREELGEDWIRAELEDGGGHSSILQERFEVVLPVCRICGGGSECVYGCCRYVYGGSVGNDRHTSGHHLLGHAAQHHSRFKAWTIDCPKDQPHHLLENQPDCVFCRHGRGIFHPDGTREAKHLLRVRRGMGRAPRLVLSPGERDFHHERAAGPRGRAIGVLHLLPVDSDVVATPRLHGDERVGVTHEVGNAELGDISSDWSGIASVDGTVGGCIGGCESE